MNGDILHNIKFKGLQIEHNENDSDVTITTFTQLHKVRLGVLEKKGERIIKYIEKPTREYNVSIGIYVINKSIVDYYINKNDPMDFPDLINLLINERKPISSFHHNGLWIDLGTTEEYISVMDRLDDIMKEYPEIPLEK